MSHTKIVLVGGCFDVLHYGHVRFLQEARKQGDTLIVALESDMFIEQKKHRHPIHLQVERKTILEELRCVDQVIMLSGIPSPQEYQDLVMKVRPGCIAITEGDPQKENKEAMARSIGAQVVVVTPLVRQLSTSAILSHTTND